MTGIEFNKDGYTKKTSAHLLGIDLKTPVGLKRLSFLANSDFHKPKHIYSWKTLLHCEKDADAIKECIRRNEHVAITLYRDGMSEGGGRGRHVFVGAPEVYSQAALPFKLLTAS